MCKTLAVFFVSFHKNADNAHFIFTVLVVTSFNIDSAEIVQMKLYEASLRLNVILVNEALRQTSQSQQLKLLSKKKKKHSFLCFAQMNAHDEWNQFDKQQRSPAKDQMTWAEDLIEFFMGKRD